MSRIEKFEDLLVWQNTVNFSTQIYLTFSNCKDYSFRDQICRASVSVPSNIAEGFERQYNKEFIQFLYIAKGSAGEVRTQLLIGKRIGFISEIDYNNLNQEIIKISSQLYKLIKIRKDNF